jgi:general secretion pathway protein J
MEIALAVAILSLMATLTWGSIARSFDTYEAVEAVDSRYHGVRVAMARMAKEISMAYLTSPQRSTGIERMSQTIFKSERASPFQVLHFTAFAHLVRRRDAKESDQCEISYFGEQDEEDPKIFHLMRREDPRIDSEPEEGGPIHIMLENIKDFRLRFYNGRDDDWVEEWDTTKSEFNGRLPELVEFTVVVTQDDRDETFITKARVNLTTELGPL